MPYGEEGRFEKASKLGHVSIVQNEWIQKELQNYKYQEEEDIEDIDLKDIVTNKEDTDSKSRDIKLVVAFDGSSNEVPINKEYPSNRVGFIQISSVIVRLEKVVGQQKKKFVDPEAMNEIAENDIINFVMPSSNTARKDANNLHDSWRKEVFQKFKEIEVNGSSLLEILLDLINYSENKSCEESEKIFVERCPVSEEKCGYDKKIKIDSSGGACPKCGSDVYPTDTLRTHEKVNENHNNEGALNFLMIAIEHISMVAAMRYMQEENPENLEKSAFVVDGNLAIFGVTSWLHRPILEEIKSIRHKQLEMGYKPPLVVGTAKSGTFYDHAQMIKSRLDGGDILEVSEDYINTHIMPNRSSETEHGSNTYYGQKFIYKTNSGKIFFLMVPLRYDNGNRLYSISDYPLLKSSAELLEEIETNLYEDALLPVALAHKYASIPKEMGSTVLKILSRDALE